MKRRIVAKNPLDEPIVDPEKPLARSANGTWRLIAMKAYELYEQRGRGDGHALEDWLKAEAFINEATE